MRQFLTATLALASVAVLGVTAPAARAAAPIEVLTTTTDLAAIAAAVGGDKVHAQPLAKGYSDIHFFEARPSDVLKIRHAKVFCQMGLELDTVWSQSLLDAARNSALIKVECSSGVPVLERPTGQVNRSMGDVHPYGNPHYQLDPLNGKIIAANIARGLSQADPGDAGYFAQRVKAFDADIDAHMKVWNAKMAPARGAKVIDYHAELAYFANRFGLKVVGFIEPKPGVPPSPVHTHDLIHLVREQNVKAVVVEQWYNVSVPNMIANETHCASVVIPTSVGGEPDITTYPQLFDRIVAKLAPVLK